MSPHTVTPPNSTPCQGVLHLTLHKIWFDLILSGSKRVEYRENKTYWRRRLYDSFPFHPKPFQAIEFRNGYGAHRPVVVYEHKSTYYNHALDKIELVLGRRLS